MSHGLASAPDVGRTVCWIPTWNPDHVGVGLEHLILRQQSVDSVLLAVDPEVGPFRLLYGLRWDSHWRLREAHLSVTTAARTHSLHLISDGGGAWRDGQGRALPDLGGCIDIDIWPTPFTNSFPIHRRPLALGERQAFRMAWVNAPALAVEPKVQAYTRLAERRYLFESLDGSGFAAELEVDDEGVVVDYPQLFRRVAVSGTV